MLFFDWFCVVFLFWLFAILAWFSIGLFTCFLVWVYCWFVSFGVVSCFVFCFVYFGL